ncbi:hypothetical protein ACH47B_06640 [Rhodococcus sp. NPDC019627]|uniref:hypothetical protein n=1 Tax=unclassified Rhodococcus (in: high G+C Gram-positive bacteria) TaxID=192944 RepID=UPI003787A8F0
MKRPPVLRPGPRNVFDVAVVAFVRIVEAFADECRPDNKQREQRDYALARGDK